MRNKEEGREYSMGNDKNANGSRPSTPATHSIDEESQRSQDEGQGTKGVKYILSLLGIIRIISMILCLLAFICEEASKACSKGNHCLSSTRDVYIFFATVTLANFLTSLALFVFFAIGYINKIKVAPLTKKLAEIVYISVVVFFLLIADIFFTVRLKRIGSLHAAAVFGYSALIAYVTHLTVMIYQLRKSKPSIENETNESSKEEDNYTWTPGGVSGSQTDTLPQLQCIRPRSNSIESDKLPDKLEMVEIDLESEDSPNKTFVIDDKSDDEGSNASSSNFALSKEEDKSELNTYTIYDEETLSQDGDHSKITKANFESINEHMSDSSSSSSDSSNGKKKKKKNKYNISGT